jgi:hypothetical protein
VKQVLRERERDGESERREERESKKFPWSADQGPIQKEIMNNMKNIC